MFNKIFQRGNIASPNHTWADRFLGSDPGLNRFRKASETLLATAAAMVAEWLFVNRTHALLINTHGAVLPAAQAALVNMQHHGLLVLAMTLGSLMALFAGWVMTDTKVRDQLVSVLFVYVPLIATLALGLVVNKQRLLGLVLLTVSLGIGTYLRKYGHRGALAGTVLFVGFLIGYLSKSAIAISGIGWLAAELALGLAVGIIIHLVFFYPRYDKALHRAQRSYAARARKVVRLSLAIFDGQEAVGGRSSKRMRRQLVRLNEAALIIDGQLTVSMAVDEGLSAQRLHERIFDIELALSNIARFTRVISTLDIPKQQRETIHQALLEINTNNLPAAKAAGQKLLDQVRSTTESLGQPKESGRRTDIIVHRFAGSIINLADALADWHVANLHHSTSQTDDAVFQSPVKLSDGWLSGSKDVSSQASADKRNQISLNRNTRTAIQMMVATGIAIAAGDALSGSRFYWAVIAVLVTFTGTNNSGEQTRKALFRVVGTLAGVGVGIALAHAVGFHTNWAIAVILIAEFLGFYLMRINYAFFVTALVVLLAQLYSLLGEFTNGLLYTRLEETALGAVIAVLTITFVLPLRTRRVLTVATRGHIRAMSTLVNNATSRLLGNEAETTLRHDARVLDTAHQALLATVEPLRRNLFGDLDDQTGQFIGLAGTYRYYGRLLVNDTKKVPELDKVTRKELEQASKVLNASIAVLLQAADGQKGGTFVRAASLFDLVGRRLETSAGRVQKTQLAIRDLIAIDEAMASVADTMGLKVTSLDTA
jgi:uncharacterized membrane protein YgaE (UPF0421/DUF939 family)